MLERCVWETSRIHQTSTTNMKFFTSIVTFVLASASVAVADCNISGCTQLTCEAYVCIPRASPTFVLSCPPSLLFASPSLLPCISVEGVC